MFSIIKANIEKKMFMFNNFLCVKLFLHEQNKKDGAASKSSSRELWSSGRMILILFDRVQCFNIQGTNLSVVILLVVKLSNRSPSVQIT